MERKPARALPLLRPTEDERRTERIARAMASRFCASPFALGRDPFIARMAALSFVEHHLLTGGSRRTFAAFDVPSFADWLADEALLHPETLPLLTEAWIALTHYLQETGRLDELSAARIRRDLHLTEPRLVARLADRYARFVEALEGA